MSRTIYNAQPALARPVQFARGMWADLLAARELAWRLFLRDLKAKYRQSILGYFWVLFPPLALTGSFLLMQKSFLLNVGVMPVPYAIYALTGMVFWQTFADAVTTPLRIVSSSKSMLVKLNFPRESLILAGMLEVGFTFLVRVAILAVCLAIFGILPPSAILALPLAFLGVLLAGTMIGVLLTPAGVLFQDFSQGLPLILSFALICTPVAYAHKGNTLMGLLNTFNPATYLIDFGRGTLLATGLPWGPFTLIVGATLLLLGMGWVLYRISLPHLIARIGS